MSNTFGDQEVVGRLIAMTAETSGTDPVRESKAKVFVSYSRMDMAFANRLDAALTARDIVPLIDRSEIYAFEDWWKRIEVLIAQSDTIVFVLSPDAVGSEVALREIEFAASLNKRFAPIVCRPVEAKMVPEVLRRLNFISFGSENQFDESADKLAAALATDIEWVRKHTEFGQVARRWIIGGRPGGLLLRSPLLEEAERWVASRPNDSPMPTEDTQVFIAQSRRGMSQRRNLLTGSLAIGFLIAIGLAGAAVWQRGIAVEERRVAEEQRSAAQEQRDRTLITQSRFLTSVSNTRREAGDVQRALALALEALPVDPVHPNRPYLGEAEFALRLAVRDATAIRLRNVSTVTPTEHPDVAILDPSGLFLVTSTGSVVRLLNPITGDEIASFDGPPEKVWALRFLPDGRLVVVSTKALQLWNVKDRKLDYEFQAPDAQQICGWQFSPDDNLQQAFKVGVTSLDDPVNLFQSRTNTPSVGQHLLVASAKCSLFGAYILPALMASALYQEGRADGSNTQFITITKDLQLSLMDNNGGIRNVVSDTEKFVTGSLSPTGRQAAIATSDGKVIVWDVRNFVRLVEFIPAGGQPILGMNFSGDGELLFVAIKGGPLKVWARESIGELAALNQDGKVPRRVFACDNFADRGIFPLPEGRVRDLAYSIDGSRALILSDVEGAPTSKELSTYEVAGRTLLQKRSHNVGEGSRCARVSPAQDRLVVVDESRLRLVNSESGEVIREINLVKPRRFLNSAFSSNGRRLVVHVSDGTLAILDTAGGAIVDETQSASVATELPSAIGFAEGGLVVVGEQPKRYGWTTFPTTQQLIEMGRSSVSVCIAPHERGNFALPDEPPEWCVELRKQPYQVPEWQTWLQRRRGGANPPVPSSSNWQRWLAAHGEATAEK